MPRTRRIWLPHAGAHTISRFVDRRFQLLDDSDRRGVLDAITSAHHRWDWEWLSWALMSSHVHFGNNAGRVPPERFFRSANTRIAQRYHRKRSNETLGPVFAARPSTYIVRRGDLAKLVAYHHRNPVRAGLVRLPRDSTWTSHRAYLRLDTSPPWFDVERALDLLGFEDTAAGRRRFDDFVTGVDLTDWRHNLRRRSDPHRRGEHNPARDGLSPEEEVRLVRLAARVAGFEFHAPLRSKTPAAVRTRRLVACFAAAELGLTNRTIGELLGMRAGSVSNLVHRPKPEGMSDALRALRCAWWERE